MLEKKQGHIIVIPVEAVRIINQVQIIHRDHIPRRKDLIAHHQDHLHLLEAVPAAAVDHPVQEAVVVEEDHLVVTDIGGNKQ